MERAWRQTSEERRGYFNTSAILVEAVRVQKSGASEAAGRQREPQDAVAAWSAPFAVSPLQCSHPDSDSSVILHCLDEREDCISPT